MKTSKLKSYFFEMSKEQQEIFSHLCGTTSGQMKQIIYGNRPCNAVLAINIDRESGGRVQCDDLCPSADFDYLRAQLNAISNIATTSDAHHVQDGAV